MEIDSDVLDLGLDASVEAPHQSMTAEDHPDPPRITPKAREIIVPIPPEYENKTLAEIVAYKIENGEMLDYNHLKTIQKRKFALAKKLRWLYALRRKVPVQDLRKKLNVQRAQALVRAYGKTGPVVHNRIGRALKGEIISSRPVKRLQRLASAKTVILRRPAKGRLGFAKLPKIIPRGPTGAPPLILKESFTSPEGVEEYYEEETQNENEYQESNSYSERRFDTKHNGMPQIIPGNRETGAPPLLLRSHFVPDDYSRNQDFGNIARTLYNDSRYERPRYELERGRFSVGSASTDDLRFRLDNVNRHYTVENNRSSVLGRWQNGYEPHTPDLPDFCPQQPVQVPPASSFVRRQMSFSYTTRTHPIAPTTPPEEYVPEPIHPRNDAVEQVYVPTRTGANVVSEAKVTAVHVFSTGVPLHQRISAYPAALDHELTVKIEP